MNNRHAGTYKYPICLHPAEIVHFIEAFIQLLYQLPAGKTKTGPEELYAEFKEYMEADGFNKYERVIPNEMPIRMEALQEIYEISNSLSYIMMAFDAAKAD